MERKHFNHFNIAGFTFYDGPIVFDQLKVGTELTLLPEPDNRYDPKAVAIYYSQHKLGFIPKGCNAEIFKLLTMGHNVFETRIQRIDPHAHMEEQVGVIVYVVGKANNPEDCSK
jgi:hypothetical protein